MLPNSQDGRQPLNEFRRSIADADVDPDELKGNGGQAQSIIFTDHLYLDPDKTNRSHVSFFNKGKSKTAEKLRAELTPRLGLRDMGWGKDKLGKDAVVFLDGSGKTHVGGQLPGWFDLYSQILVGRVANYDGRRMVSFWGRGADLDNPGSEGPTSLIQRCVQELYYKDAVDDDTVVVYGDGRISTVGDILSGNGPGEELVDPKAVERTELAKRMHLAGSAEKKAIRKQLGVGGGGSEKRDPWDAALQSVPQDEGGLAPGHNRWRMTSEGKQRALENALDQIQSRV